ncbi:MAG: hypothetical protein ACP5RF_01730 [Candidatus Micrarchaeia archaeon]
MRSYKGKSILVLSNADPTVQGCPTMKLNESSIKMRDDYYGRVRFGKKLISAFTSI